MSEPVDTDALRKAGERADYYQTGEAPLWRAAADELDRLRVVIVNAPHGPYCQMPRLALYPDPEYPYARCTCWKADAL